MAALLSYALTTLNDVKETLGIDSGDHSQDNLIIRKINQATEIIEGYCFRRFKKTTYTDEIYDGTLIDQLILRNFPVDLEETFALGARDSSLNTDNFSSIDTDQFFIDANAGTVDGLSTFYGGWGRWRVSYTAGYATIPADLAEACVALAAYFVSNDPATNANVTMKREGSREIQYGNSGAGDTNDLLEELGIKTTLDRYARNPISGYI